MVDLSRFNDEGFGIFLGNFYDVVVVDCCPFELPLVLLAMSHHESPLDLYPGVEEAKVLVLVVIEEVLQLYQLVLLEELETLVKFVLNDVDGVLLLLELVLAIGLFRGLLLD